MKPEVDEGEDGEKRGKIMSEVFLTRLLSTKVQGRNLMSHFVMILTAYIVLVHVSDGEAILYFFKHFSR